MFALLLLSGPTVAQPVPVTDGARTGNIQVIFNNRDAVQISCRCSQQLLISCLDSSLLECSPAVPAARVRIPAEACLSRGL